jgi:hypothetical protein
MHPDIEAAVKRFSAVPISQVSSNDKPLTRPLHCLEKDAPHVRLLQQKFDELLERDPYVRGIVDKLRAANLRGAIFGGWIRDHLSRELGNPHALDGHTRTLHCLKNNIEKMFAVVVENVSAPLPGKPSPLARLALSSGTIAVKDLIPELNMQYFRDIEAFVHPIT